MLKIRKNTVFYSAMILSFSNISMQVLVFLYRIFLSRTLGAEIMGIYQMIFPVSSVIMSVALSGLCTAVTHISSQQNALKDKAGMSALVRMALCIFAVLFSCAAVPTVLFSKWISKNLLGDDRTQLGLLILMPCILLTGIENIIKAWFYGVKDVKHPVTSDILEFIVRIASVAAMLLSFKPKDPAHAVAFVVAGMTISEVFSTIFLGKRFAALQGFSYKDKQSRLPLFYQIVSIALPVSASAVLNNLINSANTVLLPQRLVVSGMTKPEAISALGILLSMVRPLFMLPVAFIGPIATVMPPRISEGLALKNTVDIKRKTGKALYTTSVIAMPAATLLMIMGSPICDIIYKQSVPPQYMALAAAASLLTYYHIISASILNGLGLQRKLIINAILGGVIQLIFTWFAAADSRLGIYGFLYGDIVSSAAVAALDLAVVEKKTRVNIDWMRYFALPALFSFIVGFAAKAVYLSSAAYLGKAAAAGAGLVAGLALYLLLLRLQGISIINYINNLAPDAQKV